MGFLDLKPRFSGFHRFQFWGIRAVSVNRGGGANNEGCIGFNIDVSEF